MAATVDLAWLRGWLKGRMERAQAEHDRLAKTLAQARGASGISYIDETIQALGRAAGMVEQCNEAIKALPGDAMARGQQLLAMRPGQIPPVIHGYIHWLVSRPESSRVNLSHLLFVAMIHYAQVVEGLDCSNKNFVVTAEGAAWLRDNAKIVESQEIIIDPGDSDGSIDQDT